MSNTEYNNDLCKQLVLLISQGMDLRDKQRPYHNWKVALLAYRLAEKLLPEYSNLLFYSGLVHDLGEIGLYDVELNQEKPKEKFLHPQKGASLVKSIPGLDKGAGYILSHHELWQGDGFPKGVKGKDLSIGSQILQTSEYVAATLNRPLAGSLAFALDLLKPGAGTVYNPVHLRIMKEIFQQDDLAKVFLWGENPHKFILLLLDEIDWPKSNKEINSDEVLKAFARLIDSKQKYTAGHSLRVARYCIRIGQEMNLNQTQLTLLRTAALLHDLGKLALPLQLLDKPGPLNAEELQQVREHPALTSELLSQVPLLASVAEIAGSHHERWDGLGYPQGLAGEDIPLQARIIAVADAYDAMSTARAYRGPFLPAYAEQELINNSGSQFDPEVVQVFLNKVISTH